MRPKVPCPLFIFPAGENAGFSHVTGSSRRYYKAVLNTRQKPTGFNFSRFVAFWTTEFDCRAFQVKLHWSGQIVDGCTHTTMLESGSPP